MSINNFKLINQISANYFEYLKLEQSVTEADKNRLGFYLFILESVTGNKDVDELLDLIIDTEFCSIVFNEKNNDYGVDAVHIDDEKNEISLFNFKFRNKFNRKKGQSANDVASSMKFFSFLEYDSNIESIKEGRTKSKMAKIIKRLNSPNVWKLTLYMVSNENHHCLPTIFSWNK